MVTDSMKLLLLIGLAALALNAQNPVARKSGSSTTNDCVKFDSSGNVVDAGAACGTGTGGGTTSTTGAGPIVQSNSLISAGDSITAGWLITGSCNGNGGSTVTSGYIYTLSGCAYVPLMAFDMAATYTDRGVAGSQACDIVDLEVMQNDQPAVDHNAVYTFMAGTNDANHHSAGDGYETAVFQPCHKAAIAWLAVPQAFKKAASTTNSVCTETGTWQGWGGIAGFSGADFSHTNGSTRTCTFTTFGGPLYIWYWMHDGDGGTWTYNVDGAGAVSVATAPSTAIATVSLSRTTGYGLLRLPVSAGSHSIVFTVTSATSTSNSAAPLILGTPPPAQTYEMPRVFVGGVPRQQGDAASAATAAYNSDAQADVALLAGDGLGAYFVDIRKYLCSTVSGGLCYNAQGVQDMWAPGTTGDGGLHPNLVGHVDLKQAFENAIQFTPYAAGTVQGGTAGQFAVYNAAGTAVSGHTLVAGDIPALSYDAAGAAAAITLSGLGGQPLLSFTGSGTKTVTATAAGTSGNCVTWTAAGNVGDAGAPCGTSSGSATWATLAGGTNSASTFVLGSGASLSASGGTIAATSVPASGITGSIPYSSLSGAPSLATVATTGAYSSLSGTPTLPTFPTGAVVGTTDTQTLTNKSIAASEVNSGTLAAAQMPADYCVLTKTTIGFASLQGAASATPTYALTSLPSTSARICLVEINPTTNFSGISNLTAATVLIRSGAGTPLPYSPQQDIFGTVGTGTNNFWSDAGNAADRTNQSVIAAFTFTCSSGSCLSSGLAQGQVIITIGTRIMP